MKIKKCYIAGKIGDLPIDVYTQHFNRAKEHLLSLGYEPVSPLELPHEHDKTWHSYMKADLIALLGCDAVYALNTSRLSPGATIEINTAVSVGIHIIHEKI